MKVSLGFSNKESLGFVLLIPVLCLVALVPTAIRHSKSTKSAAFHVHYKEILDSLEKSGFVLTGSPYPIFNPQDTAVTKSVQKQFESLNRISFSEADSVTLQIVPGIGPNLAGRIIKYRESIGGFNELGQLLEVYGVKAETADLIWEYFEFEPSVFRKIKINQISQEQLSRHPYIGYSKGKVLTAYRLQHGRFDSAADLLKIKIFKAEWVQKISPYIDYD